MPRRVRSDSDDSKNASRVEGPRGRPEATKLILNSKIDAIYASMRAAGKMIMQESPASTKPSTDDTRGSQPVSVLRVCCSDPKRLSLAGSYRAFGQLYVRASFRKERGEHYIHYWKEPDDSELCGWWFSDKDGLSMAFHKDTGTRPPKTGWSIPTLSLRTFEPKKATWKP
ncbi:CPK2 [Symbiodinium necroappetens]|uniref:CPK2 protein n=1 Tax=Symbiodinium necroappetens TaxID=1628268 RepID=A0A813A5D2_9DINO|nr:CPK2 [Symbiodinium necroappetens]